MRRASSRSSATPCGAGSPDAVRGGKPTRDYVHVADVVARCWPRSVTPGSSTSRRASRPARAIPAPRRSQAVAGTRHRARAGAPAPGRAAAQLHGPVTGPRGARLERRRGVRGRARDDPRRADRRVRDRPEALDGPGPLVGEQLLEVLDENVVDDEVHVLDDPVVDRRHHDRQVGELGAPRRRRSRGARPPSAAAGCA